MALCSKICLWSQFIHICRAYHPNSWWHIWQDGIPNFNIFPPKLWIWSLRNSYFMQLCRTGSAQPSRVQAGCSQDYFTNKICSVGKLGSPLSHDGTRELLYGPVNRVLTLAGTGGGGVDATPRPPAVFQEYLFCLNQFFYSLLAIFFMSPLKISRPWPS